MVNALYIASAGHSGSTLLSIVLGSHSKAVGLSELSNVPSNVVTNEPCTCGHMIRECPYWLTVSGELKRQTGLDLMEEDIELGMIDSPHARHKRSPTYRKAWKARRILVYLRERYGVALPSFMTQRFDQGIQNRLAIYNAVRRVSGASVVVDASKGYLRGVGVVKADPSARLILLTRDGRAVYYSNLKRKFGHEYSINAWLKYYEHALPLVEAAVDPAKVLKVKYEDLAATPEKEVRRICDFAGLEYEPAMLTPITKGHHITNGNVMRFTAMKPDFAIRPDTAWKTGLTIEDRNRFMQQGAALNLKLGY